MPDAEVQTVDQATVSPPEPPAPETALPSEPVATDAPPAAAPDAAPDQPGEPTAAPAAEDVEAPTSEERKSRSQRKAEREAREAAERAERERKDREYEEFKARYEDAQRKEAERKQREEEARRRYAEFVGTEDEVAALRAKAYEPLPDPDTVAAGDWEVYKQRVAERNQAVVRLQQLETARGFVSTLQQDALAWATGQVSALLETGASLEGVDRDAYLKAGSVPDALKALRDSVAASRDAYWSGQVTTLKAQLEQAKAALEAAEARLGGQAPSPEVGGRPANGSGVSYAQFRAMGLEERQRFRRERPADYDDMLRRAAGAV